MPVGFEQAAAAADLNAGMAAGDAYGAIHRLQLLDDFWTSYLAGADPDDPASLQRDLPELRRLVLDMVAGLRDLPRHLSVVRGAIDDLGHDAVEDTLVALLASDSQGEQHIETFREQLADFDARAAIIAACDYLDATGEETERELEGKLQTITEGRFEEGDFKIPVSCALYLAAAGACVVAGSAVAVATGTIVTAPAWAGAAIGAITAWGKQKCPGSMHEISFGRRG